jgi:hypothetical protein
VSPVRGCHSNVCSVGPPCNTRLAVTAHAFMILVMKREVEFPGNFVLYQPSPHLNSVHVCGITRLGAQSFIIRRMMSLSNMNWKGVSGGKKVNVTVFLVHAVKACKGE